MIIPEPVYLLKDFSMSDGSTSSSGEHAMVPSCDVLIESFHEGVSMTDIMRSAGDNISEQVWSHNKEMAAIGLDAILKMVCMH